MKIRIRILGLLFGLGRKFVFGKEIFGKNRFFFQNFSSSKKFPPKPSPMSKIKNALSFKGRRNNKKRRSEEEQDQEQDNEQNDQEKEEKDQEETKENQDPQENNKENNLPNGHTSPKTETTEPINDKGQDITDNNTLDNNQAIAVVEAAS